jgi:hypothetical protein
MMRNRFVLVPAAIIAAGSAASADTLFSNGGFVTHPGAGANGADVSQIDSAFFGTGALLTPGGQGTEYRVAEDFTVTGEGWQIDRIRVYAFSAVPAGTSPVPPAPFTGIVMNIWTGHPRAAGSSIIATSSTLGTSVWTGVYRVPAANHLDDTNPIYRIEAVFANAILPPGTYFYDVQANASFAATPFVTDGLVNADGNGMNLFLDSVGFNPIRYGSPQRGLAFPFEVLGVQLGGGCYPNCDDSSAPPLLNVDDFTCFINTFAVAQTLPHAQQVGHYANCDGSTTAPVLNIDDFTCFINAFAAGCP